MLMIETLDIINYSSLIVGGVPGFPVFVFGLELEVIGVAEKEVL